MELGKIYNKKSSSSRAQELLIIPTEKKLIKRKVYDDLIRDSLGERTFNGKSYFLTDLGLKYAFLPCDMLGTDDAEIEAYKGEEVRTFQIKKFQKNKTLPMYKAILMLNDKEYLTQSFACKPEVENKIAYLCNRVRTAKTKNLILFSTSL